MATFIGIILIVFLVAYILGRIVHSPIGLAILIIVLLGIVASITLKIIKKVRSKKAEHKAEAGQSTSPAITAAPTSGFNSVITKSSELEQKSTLIATPIVDVNSVETKMAEPEQKPILTTIPIVDVNSVETKMVEPEQKPTFTAIPIVDVNSVETKMAEPEQKPASEAAPTASVKRANDEKYKNYLEMLNNIPDTEIVVADKPVEKRSVREVDDIPFSTVTKKSNMNKIGNFVVIDTETTGLYASKAEIVEIAAIRFRDWEPVEKFVTLCSPKKGLSEDASKINGITDDMVEGKPNFAYIAKSLQDFIGKDNIIGHNLDFDLKFIVKNGVDVEAEKRKYYDTLYIAERTLKKMKEKWDKEFECYMPSDAWYDVENYKLPTLCRYYGIPHYGAHRALADCYATGILFRKLAESKVENVSDLGTE